jgi:DNA-binding MarR family transcriptional regulator
MARRAAVQNKRPRSRFKRMSVLSKRRFGTPGLDASDLGPASEERGRISRRGKTLRAYRAYLDLLDTAAHMRIWLRRQLTTYDLTFQGFRMLEMLYREGPILISLAAQKMECSRQNVYVILARLEARGWVVREIWGLPPVERDESRIAIAKRDEEREGREAGVVARLTRSGAAFIGHVFPNHEKVVKSLMRVLDAREQVTLSRILQKLRAGDVIKFVQEIRMVRHGE